MACGPSVDNTADHPPSATSSLETPSSSFSLSTTQPSNLSLGTKATEGDLSFIAFDSESHSEQDFSTRSPFAVELANFDIPLTPPLRPRRSPLAPPSAPHLGPSEVPEDILEEMPPLSLAPSESSTPTDDHPQHHGNDNNNPPPPPPTTALSVASRVRARASSGVAARSTPIQRRREPRRSRSESNLRVIRLRKPMITLIPVVSFKMTSKRTIDRIRWKLNVGYTDYSPRTIGAMSCVFEWLVEDRIQKYSRVDTSKVPAKVLKNMAAFIKMHIGVDFEEEIGVLVDILHPTYEESVEALACIMYLHYTGMRCYYMSVFTAEAMFAGALARTMAIRRGKAIGYVYKDFPAALYCGIYVNQCLNNMRPARPVKEFVRYILKGSIQQGTLQQKLMGMVAAVAQVLC